MAAEDRTATPTGSRTRRRGVPPAVGILALILGLLVL